MTSSFLLLRRAGISNDDVSSDVITISRWIRRSAKEKLLTDEKNKGEVELLSANGDLPVDTTLGPAGLPEDPAKANHRPKQLKNREKERGLPRIIDRQGTTTQLYRIKSCDIQVRQISRPSQFSGIQAQQLSRPQHQYQRLTIQARRLSRQITTHKGIQFTRGSSSIYSSIRSTTGRETPSSACTRRPDEISTDGNSSKSWPEQVRRWAAAAARGKHGGGGEACIERGGRELSLGIQLAVGPQPLWLRNHNSGLAQSDLLGNRGESGSRRLVSYLAGDLRLAPTGITRRPALHGITDSACKNQLVVVSVQYGPFNPYIPIRSTTIGKSRIAKDPIAMHTSWRSNSDIASVTSIGYPRMSASGESSTTMHQFLHASGPHPIPPPNDPKTNQYNQDLGLIHSTNGNHLESPNEGSSIDHQVTIYLHAQNITIFPTNETWYFASQILVSSSGSLILILTAQSTRN
ncbi:hypothetical protein F511_23994 [Dorcoceras hygrometricum]|uniref:Uncharacterized protein n=1 Tax=Dorcoceras hygrometricum TaxID=472368 RepID=A0A2Z7AA26_9LAMI|nr:hypothetical protein F511_23994 [Dorcoceras hygrometricum]